MRPARQRLPMPRAAVLAICGWMLYHGLVRMAVATALTFVAYLRPAEALALRQDHLVHPVPGINHWGLILHDSALQVPGKTGMWDAAVEIDQDNWLLPALEALFLGLPPRASLWDFQAHQWRSQFQAAAAALQLDAISNHLYSLRHGGASDDLLGKRRPLDAIRERGRWMSDASLRRYAKATLLQREVSKVPVAVLTYGSLVQANFTQMIVAAGAGKELPVRLPLLRAGEQARKRQARAV